MRLISLDFSRSLLSGLALFALLAPGCNKQGPALDPDDAGLSPPDLARPERSYDLASPADLSDAGSQADGGTAGADRIAVAGGTYHTCAIVKGGSVRCWGWNEAGQLGLGDRLQRGDTPDKRVADLPTVDLGTGRTAVSLSAGWYHTCAILDDGSLKCWGSNTDGECGLGQATDYGDEPNEMGDKLPVVDLGAGRTARQLASGEAFACAILDNGQVKCWGDNSYGKLGQGDKVNRGDGPNEMGDKLPPVSLGLSRTARAIAAGRNHVCVMLDDLRVKCWGRNLGQLGQGDTQDRGDDPNELGDKLPAINLGTGRTARQIAAGENHSCALLDNGQLKCWGTNYYGELGLGDAVYRGDGPGEMGDALPAIDLGTGRTARQIFATSNRTCALLDDDSVKCWGSNTLGELGFGRQGDWGNQANQMGDKLPAIDLGTGRKVRALYSGYSHLCSRLDNDALKCWGWNGFGQLGLGDKNSRGDEPGEMGDKLPALVTDP